MGTTAVAGVPGAENMATDQEYQLLSSAAAAPTPVLSPWLIAPDTEMDGERVSHNGYSIETCAIAVRQALNDPNPHK